MSRVTLINTNRMQPVIAPVGLDYLAGALREGGVTVSLVDLALTADPQEALRQHFAHHEPTLVGMSFRNVDDCFWPSGVWFIPELVKYVAMVRQASEAPLVLGGVGFSVFAERIVEHTGAEFGIRGDGEAAAVSLLAELVGSRRFERVPGLIWRSGGTVQSNTPAWPTPLSLPTARCHVDNSVYFARGGQGGIETKRGCDRSCIYCADRLAKGRTLRCREPAEVADEVEHLLTQGVDVLHLCDAEFNIPRAHAVGVCEELIRRRLGERVRWYAYLAVVPFDEELAALMYRAGCRGINFTGDAGNTTMLCRYRQVHGPEDLAAAVRSCRRAGIRVMLDLLLGGPGETATTLAETIAWVKQIDPDCVGAALGVRVYPQTEMAQQVAAEGPLESNAGIVRHYDGPVDFFRPTFYIAPALGESSAALVRDLVGGDERFFEPMDASGVGESDLGQDHNYNDNTELTRAIERGARGAYWDILRQLRLGTL